jgi:lipoate-protein ligase A
MALEILPRRTGGAAENMALDFLLLQRYPHAAAPRFRHYGWRGPAFTFGYAQKIAQVRRALPTGTTPDLCRRPTGGGVVDHRDDWTYALVIPRGHALEEVRATQSYRAVHEALAAALRAQGVPGLAKPVADEPIGAPAADPAQAGVCFQRAELYDVVHEQSGMKIAGAAQKRNKRGLLFQGSIWRPAAGVTVDWEKFHDDFGAQLATVLGTTAVTVPWPELNEDEVSGLTEQYSAAEWIESR